MSNKYDVVVIGGGISGQLCLRVPLSALGLRELAAWGGARGGGGQSLLAGAPRLSMHWQRFSASRVPQTEPSLGEGCGVPLHRNAGAWKSVGSLLKFWGQTLNFSPKKLLGLRLL